MKKLIVLVAITGLVGCVGNPNVERWKPLTRNGGLKAAIVLDCNYDQIVGIETTGRPLNEVDIYCEDKQETHRCKMGWDTWNCSVISTGKRSDYPPFRQGSTREMLPIGKNFKKKTRKKALRSKGEKIVMNSYWVINGLLIFAIFALRTKKEER